MMPNCNMFDTDTLKVTTTVSKVNTNNDGLSSDHQNKEKDGIMVTESSGSQGQKRQDTKDATSNSRSTTGEMSKNDDVVTSSPTEGDGGVGGASAGRTIGSYHFYYDNDQEEETEGENIVSMASNSSGGTTSMPPTPTSLSAQKQQHQHHHLPPPPPPEEPVEEYRGLRRQASRLTLKRRSLTKKLKKAVSFHKLSNKRDSVVMQGN